MPSILQELAIPKCRVAVHTQRHGKTGRLCGTGFKQRNLSSGGRLSGLYRRVLAVGLLRPWLWPTLLSAAWAFRARGWYRRPPFLPRPSKVYMEWRLDTAYGDPAAVPPTDELLRFLKWSRAMRRRMRR